MKVLLGVGLLLVLLATPVQGQYVLDISDGVGAVGETVDVTFLLNNSGLSLSAWGWGVCEGGQGVASIDSVDQGADVAALNNGAGPEFYALTFFVDGFGVAAVVELLAGGTLTLPPGVGLEMNVGHYLPARIGTQTLFYCSSLGNPPLTTDIILYLDGGGTVDETTGNLTLLPGSVEVPDPAGVQEPFLRGDGDGDGLVNGLVDGLFILAYGFLGGPEPSCFNAADVDDDGTVNGLVDTLYLLAYSFTGGTEPPDPGPSTCGIDPTMDGLDCVIASIGC